MVRSAKRWGGENDKPDKASKKEKVDVVPLNTDKLESATTNRVDFNRGIIVRLINAIIKGETLTVISTLEEEETLASSVDDQGRNLLVHACFYDRFCIARVLRGFEVDVDRADRRGFTPLHAACMTSKNPELFNYLVRQGASIYAVTSLGRTILHVAARKGNVVGIRFALSQGMDVDVRAGVGDDTRLTPLALAFAFLRF